LKSEEALFIKAQFQALLFESLKHKTKVFHVIVQRAVVDTNLVEVDRNEFV
jgi:hypothetical protein